VTLRHRTCRGFDFEPSGPPLACSAGSNCPRTSLPDIGMNSWQAGYVLRNTTRASRHTAHGRARVIMAGLTPGRHAWCDALPGAHNRAEGYVSSFLARRVWQHASQLPRLPGRDDRMSARHARGAWASSPRPERASKHHWAACTLVGPGHSYSWWLAKGGYD